MVSAMKTPSIYLILMILNCNELTNWRQIYLVQLTCNSLMLIFYSKKKLEYIYKTRQNAAFEHEFNKANLKVSTNYRIMEMYSENI